MNSKSRLPKSIAGFAILIDDERKAQANFYTSFLTLLFESSLYTVLSAVI
jgi:hypothetical protein